MPVVFMSSQHFGMTNAKVVVGGKRNREHTLDEAFRRRGR